MTTDRAFLHWTADRLVHQYGENPGIDFVRHLRSIAESLPPERETPGVVRPSPADAWVPLDLLEWALVLLDDMILLNGCRLPDAPPSPEQRAAHEHNVERLRQIISRRNDERAKALGGQ